MTPLFRALVVLSVTLICSWGAVYYAYALTAPLIAEENGWSKPFVYAGFSLTMVVAGLASPWVGRAIDRHGGRVVMTAGSLVAALGLALLGLAHGEIAFLIACAVCGGGMAMTFYDAGFATLTWMDVGRARRAITIVTLAGGLASTVFWPLTQWLLTFLDWREVCLAYAALHALVCAPLHYFALPHEPISDHGRSAPLDQRALDAEPLQGRARWEAFGLFALLLVAQGFVSNGIAIHLLPALSDLGTDPRSAILVGSLIGPAQVSARLLDLAFGRVIAPMSLGLAAIAAMPLAFLVLLLAPLGGAALVAFALLYGFGNGLLTIARGVIPLTLFGREGYGGMLGLLAAPTLIVQAASPTVLAIASASLGVRPMLWICAASVTFAFLAMVGLAVRFSSRPVV
ncbi:MAG: MFS transporter [Beijerinckiaceae bacterium]